MALDNSPNVINLSDNASLQYLGANVKMKATVLDFSINVAKDFYLTVTISFYVNNAGSYGAKVTDDIIANATLSADQQAQLLNIYQDRTISYTTSGKYTDASGNITTSDQVGAIPELQYWQGFFVNQIPGFGTAGTTGALQLTYLIIAAIINKLNTRKKW